MPETTESPKPELKSFEDAAAAFMKQAEVNEYGGDAKTSSESEALKFKEPQTPQKPESKPSETKAESTTDSRRVPASLFKKEGQKAEEPAPVESEIDKIEAPEFKDPAKAGQWDSLKGKAKEWEKKARELETQLSKGGETTQQLEEFKKQIAERDAKLKEMSARLERSDWDSHEEGGVKYRNNRDSLIKQAQALITDNGGDGAAMETALNLKGKPRIDALREIADDLPGYQQGILGQMIRELDALDSEASAKREKSSESWKEIQREQQERQQRDQEEFSTKAIKTYDAVKRDMQRELEVLQELPDRPWWNDQRKDIMDKSDKFFTENEDMREGASAAIWKHAGPVYRDLYLESDKHIEKIEGELAEAKKALEEAYGNGPRAAGAIRGGVPGSKKTMTFEERVLAGE